MYPFSKRQSDIAGAREPTDKNQFVLNATLDGGDCMAAELIWDKLQEWIYCPTFTAKADDDLERVFGIAEEELDEDIILDILNKTGVPVPDQGKINNFGAINTPKRIAEFVTHCRTLSD